MKKKLLYIRTPKTSSTSLYQAISLSQNKFLNAASCLESKMSADDYIKYIEEYDIVTHGPIRVCSNKSRRNLLISYIKEHKKQKKWTPFAIVRDPYTKFLSSVNHWLTKEALDLVLENDIPFLQGNSILNNLDDKIKKKMPRGKGAKNIFHQMPTQTSFIFYNNEPICKFLKFEDREEIHNFFIRNGYKDVVEIMNERGTRNASYEHKPKPFKLNQKIINYVNKFYGDDFANFGYKML